MSKGYLDPKYNKGFTEEEVAMYKSQWKDMSVNKHGRIELTPKEEGKPKAMSRFAFVMHCAGEYSEQMLKRLEESGIETHSFDRRLATQIIILECIKHAQALGFYKIVDIVDSIQMVVNPQGLANNILNYLDARDEKSRSKV
jgi:coenzyme F420-reducing hydrogenase alpha subunit